MQYTAKSIILDCANNWGDATYLGLREVDFYFGGSKLSITSSNATAYATTTRVGGYFESIKAFNTTLTLVGSDTGNCWNSFAGKKTNQRLIVVFASEQTFDKIILYNSHSFGAETDIGVKEVKIYASSDTITNTTYNATISNSILLFEGSLDEHIASNVADPQEIEFSNDIAFSLPEMDFTGMCWFGDSYLQPTMPVFSPLLVGTFHTPGIITDLPCLDVSVVGTFILNTVNLITSWPGLDFKGNITSNKILLEESLPCFVGSFLTGAQISESFSALTFFGFLKSQQKGTISASLPFLDVSLSSGAQFKTTLPNLSANLQGTFTAFVDSTDNKIAVFLPSLTCNLFGTSNITSILNISLPQIHCSVVTQNNTTEILKHIRGVVR